MPGLGSFTTVVGPLMAILALVAGILILVRPRIMNYIVAIYLIVVGVLGLLSGGFSLMPVLALVAGILILIMPRLLNYVVAIYLIVIGIMGLIAYF